MASYVDHNASTPIARAVCRPPCDGCSPGTSATRRVRITREHSILCQADAAQSGGKMPTDVDDLGVDLLSLGHGTTVAEVDSVVPQLEAWL